MKTRVPHPLATLMRNGYFREDLDPLTSKGSATVLYNFFLEYEMDRETPHMERKNERQE